MRDLSRGCRGKRNGRKGALVSNVITINQSHVCIFLGRDRVRLGYAHVANNKYDEWKMYAIGGSANPTIFSEGNYFVAPDNRSSKKVTKREATYWQNWKWQSSKDVFINGAYFVPSGYGSSAPLYT